MERKFSQDWKAGRRWRAVELYQEGWNQLEIAEALGVTKGAVSQWMKALDSGGPEALRSRPRCGGPPKLGREALELLPDYLSHGAEAYGFRGQLWTCARVAWVIEQEFGVCYHKAHVSRLLKQLNWTPQRPVQRASQRDEAQIEAWRSTVWPRLKKGPSGRTPARLCGRSGVLPPAGHRADLRAPRTPTRAEGGPNQ